ncbi:hypothetical protein Emed_003138 [Eimeria media]
MERRRLVQAALAVWAFKGLFLDEAEAFKTQRPRDAVFSSSVELPSSMLETQWGSDYVDIPGTTEDDGSLTFVFVNSIEGTVVAEPDNTLTLSEENSCAALEMQANGLEEGKILKLVDITTVNECQEICRKTLNCNAAQFDRRGSTCTLLKSFTGLSQASGIAVVLASCETDCFTEEERLTGVGSSLGKVPNANMCQALCASNAACKGFTFMKSSNECLSFPDDSDLTIDENAISGSKGSCTPHVQTTQYNGSCSIPNMSGTGLAELEVVQNIDSYEECRKLCLTNPRCNYLTFNSGDRRCYVKPGEGVLRQMKAGDTTGPRLCDGSCFLQDIELSGEAIKTIENSRSAHFCHYECSMNESCAMFSYHSESKMCSLYAESSDLSGRHSEGVWTGPKGACPMEDLYKHSAPRCAVRAMKFNNEDPLKSMTTETAEACGNECANSSMCEAFTYSIQQKKCDLLLATAETRREANMDYISGAKVCNGNCILKNMEYTGTAFETFTDGFETAELCQLRCQATTGCTSWNYNPVQKSCKLLDSSSTRSSAGMISGAKYCDGACDIFNYRLNTHGWSSMVNAANVEACRVQCKRNNKCQVMTKTSTLCTLYDEFAFVRLEQTDNARTGINHCSTCFREGVGYKVDDKTLLMNTDAQNAEECRIRCSFMEDCTRFTYNAKTKVCSMLSGETGDVKGNHLISGPSTCQQPSTSCFRNNTAYDIGNYASAAVVKSLQECQERCEKEPRCKIFNYQDSAKGCHMFTGDVLTTKTNNGWTAGKKKCLTLTSAWTCADDNKDYYGSDIIKNSIKTNDAYACRDICQSDPACETWMYYTSAKDCWKKKIKAYTAARVQKGTYSGSRAGCPLCARWQRQYTGRVVGTKTTTNQAMCQLECQLNNDCNFFTFGPGSTCKLFADEGTIQQTTTDIYSGPKRC